MLSIFSQAITETDNGRVVEHLHFTLVANNVALSTICRFQDFRVPNVTIKFSASVVLKFWPIFSLTFLLKGSYEAKMCIEILESIGGIELTRTIRAKSYRK